MNPPPVPRYNVLGVGVSALSLAQARDLVVGARGARNLGYVCLCTVNGLGEARRDPGFRRIFNESWLTTPDGMPLVWMGPPGVERVYGPDLMLAVMELSERTGWRHFFYGGAEGTVQTLKAKLLERFPKLRIVGACEPPFRPLNQDELQQLREELRVARPDILWVGLSTPKQERFMAQYLDQLDVTLMCGVGAAFDFHAGKLRQAPKWMQRAGLEWFFRLCCEPRRLWKRYFKNNPLFMARIFCQCTGLRKFPLHN